MAELHNLLPTDASNVDRFPEGMAPSSVNNAARALEGMIARWYFDTNYSVTATLSGTVVQMTANRASITLTGTTSNYVADLLMAFTVGATGPAGPCKININGIGPISLRDNNGVSLSSSAIPSGSKALIVKDGTNDYFRLLSHVPGLTYEEGTWTPADGSGAGLSFSGVTARYTKIGRTVFCEVGLTYPSTASGSNAVISGLPFANNGTTVSFVSSRGNAATSVFGVINVSVSTIAIINSLSVAVLNSSMSTQVFVSSFHYSV